MALTAPNLRVNPLRLCLTMADSGFLTHDSRDCLTNTQRLFVTLRRPPAPQSNYRVNNLKKLLIRQVH
jgi:hypothetical protein